MALRHGSASPTCEPHPTRGVTNCHDFSAKRWKSRRSALATSPGAPLPTGRPSIRTTGITVWLAEVMKASRAACASATVKARSSSFSLWALNDVEQHGAGDAAQDRVVGLAGDQRAVAGDDPGVGGRAFGDGAVACRRTTPRGRPAPAPPAWRARSAAAQIDLMSTRSQRLSGSVMTAMPSAAIASVLAGSIRACAVTTIPGRVPARRKGMVALGDAAGDLQIDDAVANAVSPHHLMQHDAQRRERHRQRDPQFRQRAREPLHVPALVDQAAVPHLADFVNAVGEQIAAILE